MAWISELESAQLGTVNIGTYATEIEAHEATEKWLRESYVSDGKRKISMLELIEESFSDDIHIYETDSGLEWENDND